MRCPRAATSLLFLSLLLELPATSDADDRLQQLGRELLNLDLRRSEIPREALAGPAFSLGWREEDLLRRRIESIAVADLNAAAGTSRVDLPWRWQLAHGAAAITASSGRVDYAGRSKRPGWNSRVSGRGRGFDITLTATADRHRLLLSLTQSRHQGHERVLELERFHRSKSDERKNRFFWDLIEPTTGDSIHIEWSASGLAVALGYGYHLTSRDCLEVELLRERRSSRLNATYQNRGEREELRGERPLEGRQSGTRRGISARYARLLASHLRIGAELGARSHRLDARAMQLDVPLSERGVLLDLVALGAARGSYDGRHFYLTADLDAVAGHGADRRRARQLAGRVTGEFAGDFLGETPVLGFTLLALPISHGARGRSEGRLSSTILGATGQVQRGTFDLGLGLYTAWSDLKVETSADTEMQFGLVVAPYHNQRSLDVNIYRLELRPAWTLEPVGAGSLRFEIELRQYLLAIDDREQKPAADMLSKDEQVRGGRIAGLLLTYSR